MGVKKRPGLRRRVGQRVRELREAQGLSQEDLALKVGDNYRHLGQVERGELSVGLDVLGAIAGALGVTLSDLFAGVESSAGFQTVLVPERHVDAMVRALEAFRRIRRPARRSKPRSR